MYGWFSLNLLKLSTMKLKSLFKLLSVSCLIFIFSCTQKEKGSHEALTSTYNELVFKSVPEKEYKAASPFIKRLINKLDASVTALNMIKKNSSVKSQAIIFISRDTNEKNVLTSFFSNSLFITPIDSSHADSTSSESGVC